jgi:tRNA pseudouridine(38-40) synthase
MGKNGKNWKGFSKSFSSGQGRHGNKNRDTNYKGTDDRRESSERSKGSYDWDELQASDAYKRRTEGSAPKRKYAVCFGYLGTNYSGLQANPDAETIEKEVERALFLAGGLQDSNFGNLQKLQWTRAARTDRGVHANGQCCSMRLSVPISGKEEVTIYNDGVAQTTALASTLPTPEGWTPPPCAKNDAEIEMYRQRQLFINRVNSFLPIDIHIHAMCKVTKAFNAKNLCGSRRYHYLLPTYMIRKRSEVMQHLANVYEQQGPVEGAGMEGGFLTCGTRGTGYLGEKYITYAYDDPVLKGYRVDADTLNTLKEACNKFVGTHKYHNYTTAKLPSDPSSCRYIKKFSPGEPFVSKETGIEFVLLTIYGQSFLLNQIRRMVGMCCEVASGAVDMETLSRTQSDKKVEVPMVPGLGLYLDELFFDGYNQKIVIENANAARKKVRDAEYAQTLKAAASKTASTDTDPVALAAVATVAAAVGGVDAMVSAVDVEDSIPMDTTTSDDQETDAYEVLDWQDNAFVQQVYQDFRADRIWPHIQEEEKTSRLFVYYLDSLRAHPRRYISYDFYEKKDSANDDINLNKNHDDMEET